MLINKDKVLAIIIARGGSKSVPHKNILSLKGKPLVAWPIELAKSVKRIDKVVVSTDDDQIAKIAKEYGAEVPFKRPAQLCQDDTPTLPVLQHCVNFLETNQDFKADIVLLFYPTSPFLKKERVEQALDLFEQKNCNSVLGVVEDDGRFWKKEGSAYRPFYPTKRVNRQYYEPLYRENGAVYFSKYEVLMKMNKIIDEDNIEFLVMTLQENIDIDTLSDWQIASKE